MSLSVWAASLGERLAPHVTQLRREFRRDWRAFCGEDVLGV